MWNASSLKEVFLDVNHVGRRRLMRNKMSEKVIGIYKTAQIASLERLYDKLGKKFNYLELIELSRKDLRKLTREAYSEFKNGGYGLKTK